MSADRSSRYWLWATLGTVIGIFFLWWFWNFATQFKSVDSGTACVVTRGGPFEDNRLPADVRQPGDGLGPIGIFNDQFCFPSNERFYTLSANASEADSKTVDRIVVPTVDAVDLIIEGNARFTLTTNEKLLKEFYISYGNRTYDGKYPYDGGAGWENFLARTLRPLLVKSIREEVGRTRCSELLNTCQYVLDPERAAKGEVEAVDTGQNLTRVGDDVAKSLAASLTATLGAPYFEDVRFTFERPSFTETVAEEVRLAQAKRTELATAKLEAQRQVEVATGKKRAAEQEALAFKERQRANPKQPQIELLKALCGEDSDGRSKGCSNLQVIGTGNITKLIR